MDRWHLVLSYALVLSAAPAVLTGQTLSVDELVARHIRATGGAAAWARFSTQIRVGTALPGQADLPIEAAASAPGRWAFTLHLPRGRTMLHGFDGKQGWQSRGTASRMAADDAFEESLIHDPYWVLRLKEVFPKTEMLGVEKNGEGSVYAIRAFPATGPAKMLYFDTKTGFLLRAGKVMYADYRDAGGLTLPYLVRYSGQTFQFREIRLGAPVEAARFLMPPGPPEVPKATAENLPEPGQLLEKYVKAIGGAGAVESVRDRFLQGTVREDGREFSFEARAQAPGKWRLEIRTADGQLDREGCDGRLAWSQSAEVIRDLPPAQGAELAAWLDPQWPARLLGAAAHSRVLGKEKRGERELLVVEVAPAGGPRQHLWLDAGSGLLAQVDGLQLEDYRAVDGLQLPFTARLHGGEVTLSVQGITHQAPREKASFDRPLPGAEFEKKFLSIGNEAAVGVLKKLAGQGVTPADGRMLYDLIVEKKYRRALDVGTAHGYAAMWFALAMQRTDGQVTTIEIDPETADQARENFRRAGLNVDSRINDALLEIPALQGEFDFVFLDTGAPLNKKLLDLVRPKMRRGGAITAHNASGFAREQPDFLKAIEGDPELETRIEATHSGGISISVKR